MRGSLAKFAAGAAIALLSGAVTLAQQPAPSPPHGLSPTCQQLQAQLAALDSGNAEPQRATQIQQAEDAVNRQQFVVDQLVSRSRRLGCGNSGFFSIFNNPPRACGGLSRQIDQARSTLEQLQNNLEQLNGNTAERAAQRQSLLLALGDNNCGPQYRSALANQQGGFLERLFGGSGGGQYTTPPSTPSGPLGNTYTTVCVRSCDGYYFPVSFSTTPAQFQEDAQTCQRVSPNAQVQLYTYHNPGQDISQAVSLDGRLYSQLPTAFEYRKKLVPGCSFRRPGESWYEALKGGVPDENLAPGGVVVTEQNGNKPGQAQGGSTGTPASATATASVQNNLATVRSKNVPGGSEPALAEAPGRIDHSKRKVRTIGPTFLPR